VTDGNAPIPRRSGVKFLLDFFTKKSRVQGGALTLPAQGRPRIHAPQDTKKPQYQATLLHSPTADFLALYLISGLALHFLAFRRWSYYSKGMYRPQEATFTKNS